MIKYSLFSTVAIVAHAWQGSLKSSHYWDCNGDGCDAGTLQPWNESKYSAASQYAPVDPAKHGGALYGEKMWMTGAASDTLSAMMGPNASCCGHDSVGGCGKCLLVRNPSAVNSDWTVVVMKKSQCPPNSYGCEAGVAHFDLAAPGYDNLQYSTANICGSGSRDDTYITKAQSAICGDWYTRGSSTIQGCNCSQLPTGTSAQKNLKAGCDLFTAWGWTSGDPQLDYQVVNCPAEFEKLISAAFNANGPQTPSNETLFLQF